MKTQFIILFFILVACGKANQHEGHEMTPEADSTSSNKALYNQVMDLHDEVMGMGSEIYSLKKDIQDQLTTPGLSEDQKETFQRMILKLDSADKGMMDWMHKFSPPDSVDEETMREYLESEIEKMKKLRDYTSESLKEAGSVSLKK